MRWNNTFSCLSASSGAWSITHRDTATMMAKRRLPPNIQGRLASLCCCKPRTPSQRFAVSRMAVRPASCLLASQTPPTARFPRPGLRECASAVLGEVVGLSGVRYVSGKAKKVAHGARTETPAIPSFIEIRYQVSVKVAVVSIAA